MTAGADREVGPRDPTAHTFPRAGSHFGNWALPILTEHCPRGSLLELGCGSGRDLVFLVRHGFRVVGVDHAPDAVARARSRVESLPVDRRGAAEILETEMLGYLTSRGSASTDAVYGVLAYQHQTLQQLEKLFREIHRVLRSGGLHLFCVQDTTDPYFAIQQQSDSPEESGNVPDLPCQYFTMELCDRFSADRFERLEFHRHARTHTLAIADQRKDGREGSKRSA